MLVAVAALEWRCPRRRIETSASHAEALIGVVAIVMAAFGSPPIATGTTPATLIKAVGRLKRLRESAAEATAAVNKLHAKYAGARSLPATEAERVSVVGELDAAYIAALKCAQEERSAALRCLRTMEDLSRVEGGTGRFSAGRPSEDAAGAAAPDEPVAAAASAHPYGSAPGWGAAASDADGDSSAAGG